MLMKNNKYYTSRRILISYFIILIIVPYMLLNIIQIWFSINEMKKQTVNSSMEVVEQLNLNVEKQVDKIKNFIYVLSSSDKVYSFLTESEKEKYDFNFREEYTNLENFISENTIDGLKIESVVFVTANKKVYSYGKSRYSTYEKAAKSDWYQKTMDANGKICWFANKELNEKDTYNYNLISCKSLFNVNTLENMGAVYIEVNNDFFDIPLSNKDDKSLMYVVDSNKKILFSLIKNDFSQSVESVEQFNNDFYYDDGNRISNTTIGNTKYVTVFSKPSCHGWITVKSVPVFSLIDNVLKLSIVSIIILLICLTMFSIYFSLIYRKISQPLQQLISLVNEIKSDPDIDVKLDKYPCYEAMKISSDIITLFKENETINNELQECSYVKDKIELGKLQAEINPHFIYNTLTTIKYIAVQNHQTEIDNMITALVKILRSTVNRDGYFITVHEELQNLNEYIYIQKILNNERIKFKINTQEELDLFYIPNFILQPLVENSILHGLNPKGCVGTVCINNFRDGDFMVFEVIDDGVGITENSINNLNIKSTNKAGLSNIALPGIIKKIELLYDGKASVNIGNMQSGGTQVTIRLPIMFFKQ